MIDIIRAMDKKYISFAAVKIGCFYEDGTDLCIKTSDNEGIFIKTGEIASWNDGDMVGIINNMVIKYDVELKDE